MTVRRLPVPEPTPLQRWLVAALDILDVARAELNGVEFEALLDVLCCKIARLYIARLGVVDRERSEEEPAA